MAEQKTHECAVQEVQQTAQEKSNISNKSTDKLHSMTVPVSIPIPVIQTSQNGVASVPVLTKAPPNDLYRRLLPAVLFLLTFVTVMTMLLIYMDTVALGAQQFRLNMSRDYELASIPQDSKSLITYVRQLHLTPKQSAAVGGQPSTTRSVQELEKVFGKDYVGTFLEVSEGGGRSPTAARLEADGWSGTAARAAPQDYLARPARAALHACLSPTEHPREIAYQSGNSPVGFSSRVLCLPLYSMLAAADCTPAVCTDRDCTQGGDCTSQGTDCTQGGDCTPEGADCTQGGDCTGPDCTQGGDCTPPGVKCTPGGTDCTSASYVSLAGEALAPALTHVPFDKVHLKVIEIRSPEPATRKQITDFLSTKNYTVLASFDDSVMFKLND